jgi:hypothetical protein
MKMLLLAGTALIGLSASTAFATTTASAVNASDPSAMSSDIGNRPAVAGAAFGGSAGQSMPGDPTAPESIAPRPSRIDPPNLFQNPWGDGGSG